MQSIIRAETITEPEAEIESTSSHSSQQSAKVITDTDTDIMTATAATTTTARCRPLLKSGGVLIFQLPGASRRVVERLKHIATTQFGFEIVSMIRDKNDNDDDGSDGSDTVSMDRGVILKRSHSS